MAHTFDTKSRIAPSTSDPVTGTFTCGAGATLLVVTLAYANGTRTGAPTYNGVSLTQADQTRYAATNPEARVELWYLLAPPTGSAYTVSVPNANGLSVEVVISSYKAASGYTTIFNGAGGSQNDNGTGPTASWIVQQASMAVAVCCDGDDSWTGSPNGTRLYDTDNGTWGSGHQYYLWAPTGTGTCTLTWAFGRAEDWGAVGASFGEVRVGVNVSKANVYTVLAPPKGISVSKANVYTVLAPPKGVSVSKVVVYTVLTGSSRVSQFTAQAIEGGDAKPIVAQFDAQVIYGLSTPPSSVMSQFTAQAIVNPYADLAGSSVGHGTATGTLSATFPVEGHAYGTGSAVGNLTEGVPLPTDWIGHAYGTSVVTGTLNLPPWEGHAYGVGTAVATLDNIGPVDVRVTQTVAEVLATPAADIAVTQNVAEVLATPAAEIAVTQNVAEVLTTPAPEIQVTQTVAEVLSLDAPSLLVTQTVSESLTRDEPAIIVEQVIAEVLVSGWRRRDFMPVLQQFMG